MKKRLGIGFIGGGFITGFHIRSLLAVRDADVLGVFSLSEKDTAASVALARDLNVGEAKPYDSITDMVADPAIDALWICAPNYSRIENMEEIFHALEKELFCLFLYVFYQPYNLKYIFLDLVDIR